MQNYFEHANLSENFERTSRAVQKCQFRFFSPKDALSVFWQYVPNNSISMYLRNIGFDIAENEPRHVCFMFRAREPWCGVVFGLAPTWQCPERKSFRRGASWIVNETTNLHGNLLHQWTSSIQRVPGFMLLRFCKRLSSIDAFPQAADPQLRMCPRRCCGSINIDAPLSEKTLSFAKADE